MVRRRLWAFVVTILLMGAMLASVPAYAVEVLADPQDDAAAVLLAQDEESVVVDSPSSNEVVVSSEVLESQEYVQDGSETNVTSDSALESDGEGQTDVSDQPGQGESAEDEALDASAPTTEVVAGEAEGESPDDVMTLSPATGAQTELDEYAASHANDIASGLYEIQSGLGNNLVMDVDHGSTANGANIIVWTSHNATNQRWNIQNAGGGYYTISSVATGKYLDISGGDTKAGYAANIVQWAERSVGAKGQLWVVSRESDGFKLTSAVLSASDERLVLDVDGGNAVLGSKLILWGDKSTSVANQRWSFFVSNGVLDSYAAQHKGDIKDGTYVISSALGSSLVLDVAWASKDDGASVIVYPKNMGSNEIWNVSHDAMGFLTITNVNSGKVLDVSGGSASVGGAIIQWINKSDGSRNQKWVAMLQSDGTYKVVSALGYKCQLVLDVYGGNAVANSKTILWTDKGGNPANQRWSFDEIAEQYVYADALADGTFSIRTALDATKVLDVTEASKSAGTPVILWVTNGGENQAWTVSHDSEKFVHLTNKNSGKELGITSAGIAAQVSGTFRWIAEPLSDGTYRLRAATGDHAGKYLDVDHAMSDNGTTVLAWTANGGKNQTWIIGAAGSMVIALDPGHGGSDSGATANGLRECDLTWSITQSCAEQLRAYGYTVYITVGEAEFKSGSTVSIANRVQRAYDNGAQAIFSLHINAGGGHGAVTLVPNNSSYHYEFYTQGQHFANLLLPKINALGIGTWNDGAWERNYSMGDGAESNQFYPGGGYQDYYGIVRYARLKGMLGIIIEHGFIDSSDSNLLRQTAVQKKLGQADAEAIRALYV